MSYKVVASKEFLQQIGDVDKLVNEYMEMLNQQRSLITGLKSPAIDDVGGGKTTNANPDKIGEAIARLQEIADALNGYIDNLVDLKQEALAIIEKIPQIKYRSLIVARYLNLKTVERIAVEKGKDYRNTARQINRALEVFYDFWQND